METGGETVGRVVLAPRVPLDVAQQRAAIENYNNAYARLAASRQEVRRSSLLLLALIALFVLFVATWIALFLARQISVPISALLQARRAKCGRAISAIAWRSRPSTSWPAWCAASTK